MSNWMLRNVHFCVGFFLISQLVAQNGSPWFNAIATDHSNVRFRNNVEETLDFNYYNFMHIYMGAGVATGDFDNDGLPDIFFTSNSGDNRLYHNLGDFQFRDITESANVRASKEFYTGVTTVDINHDGWLDIYVSCSGPTHDTYQQNLLYINNGDLTFTESAVAYGLSEYNSHSIQANFFDFDRDGDLDVYIVNTPVDFSLTDMIVPMDELSANQELRNFGGSDKLYRNNGDQTFTDISNEAGILPDIFFGLTSVVADFNEDGWPDIYVSNDFTGPDFLYINRQDGTFEEKSKLLFPHTSNFSMGADVGDINNDGFQDLMVLDMLPEDYERSKTSMTMMPREVMYDMVNVGYNWQYMHNVLQINNGMVDADSRLFKDLSYLSGIENTDWSWSCLIADFNHDGLDDVHVTNGILRDVTNVDAQIKNLEYHNYLKESNEKGDLKHLLESRSFFPSVKLTNYLFQNKGQVQFEDKSTADNVGPPSFSNGSAYGDFDNDGDLDLVCNNVNDYAYLFENKASKSSYLKVSFNGPNLNPLGFGTKVKIYTAEKTQIKELHTTRGYFSASEPIIHFGLGQNQTIDSMLVIWPDGKRELIKDVRANQNLVVDYKRAQRSSIGTCSSEKTLFRELSDRFETQYHHIDFSYDDFDDQLLLPHKLSSLGPCLAKGDINNDGLLDLYIGGASLLAGSLFVQQESGQFIQSKQVNIDHDKGSEDMDALFFDANNDGHVDLYVVSGSYEKDPNSPELIDRLYINDGNGNLLKDAQAIPNSKNYGSCIVSLDYDRDGDMDLFVGGGVEKGKYPFSSASYFLSNDGTGVYTDISSTVVESIEDIGIVRDAVACDFDRDGDKDLIIVGEWMPVTILENRDGKFIDITKSLGLENTSGWWNVIRAKDLDNNGHIDFVIGNLGLNYKFHAAEEKPLHIYAEDFDETGTIDIVLAKNINESQYPIRGKMCSSEQMPFIKEKFPSFISFAQADIKDIIGPELEDALHLEAKNFNTSILWNNGPHGLQLEALPLEAQQSVTNSILIDDYNEDGHLDIILAGNKYESEVETSRADAGTGLYLKGNGKREFEAVPSWQSGFFAPGNIKSLLSIKGQKDNLIFVGENNAALRVFTTNSLKKPTHKNEISTTE